MESRLAADLVALYRAVDYRVEAPEGRFVLRVGARSEELAAMLAAHGQECAAFITACNPLGEAADPERNAKALAALKADLEAEGCATLGALGEGKGGWPGERSLLALGLGREAAKRLGRRYGQNAVLWAGKDAVPELVLLR